MPFSKLSFLLLGPIMLIEGHLAMANSPDYTVVGGNHEQRNHWLMFTDVENSLYRHLMQETIALAEERAETVAQINSLAQWSERQQWLKRTFQELIGPFPERTPLNAKVTGVVEKPGYRVEKILFESLPGYFVTSALYIPERLQGKAPAVLFCSGHNIDASFRSIGYQNAILNMVDKGFIVFAFDPMGQGERLQYVDPETGDSPVWSSHSYLGGQAFTAGINTARYFIWDGLRAIDYLETRPEVDLDRLGCTGNSGGGTQTAYISAFDERIKVAAPSCYITSIKRLYQLVGPQDAEQNWMGDIAAGIDFADLITIRAPKPTMIATKTDDYFSIQGAYETYEEAKAIYELYGKGENLQIVEDVGPHGYSRANIQAITTFLQQQLDLPGSADYHNLPLLQREELFVTETGYLNAMPEARILFDVLRDEAAALLKELEQAREVPPAIRREEVLHAARRISGYRRPQSVATSVYSGRIEAQGYSVEKRFVDGEGDYPIPYLLFLPANVQSPDVVIYLNPQGKAAEAAPGGQIEAIVKRGHAVLAADLLGKGELGPGVFRGDSFNFKIADVSYNLQFAALRLGRSLPGIHAGDITRLVDQVKQDERLSSGRIIAIAMDDYASALLHAAAFDDRVDAVGVVGGVGAFSEIVMNKIYMPPLFMQAVPGGLTAYDLPDLEATIAPRPLLLLDQLDHGSVPGAFSPESENLSIVRRAFADAPDKLSIRLAGTDTAPFDALLDWLDSVGR